MLELKPGMAAIQVNKREELPDAIRSVMEAVKQGELDIQIEDVAEQGIAGLRLRAPLKQLKNASRGLLLPSQSALLCNSCNRARIFLACG
jgi:hypothetical protein